MASLKSQYPHPVLTQGGDDYSSGTFTLREGSHQEKNDEFLFSFEYYLNCPGLEQYVTDGRASVILRISSSATMFRMLQPFAYGERSVSVPVYRDAIAKSISFTAFVVAEGDREFSLPEHNKTYYGDVKFTLRKGDILAESETVTVNLDASELKGQPSSIIDVQMSDEVDYNGKVRLEDDSRGKILVLLNRSTYDKYDRLKSQYPELRRMLSAVVTLPALVQAIETVRREEDGERQKYLWYPSIALKLDKLKMDLEDTTFSSFEIANAIYEDIVSDALNCSASLLSSIKEDSAELDFGGD